MAGIPVVGPALGVAAAAAALGAGLANVKRIEAAATGMDKIVNQPTMILAGEAGPEAVNITPLDSSPGAAGQQGAGVNINISGNVMSQEFVESELADKISEAVRRGTNFGLN